MKLSTVCLAIIFCLQGVAQAQEKGNLIKRLYKTFLSSEKDSSRSASFIAIPAAGYAQETGVEYGIASTYNFYLDKNDPISRTSNIMLMGTLTTKQQKNIKLQSDIWTKGNEYHIITEFRYRDWPFNYYGIGSDTWERDQDYIGQKLFRMKAEVERKITSNFYAGVNVNYEHFRFEDKELGGIFDQPEVVGPEGGQYLALGLSALYDQRNNTTYTTEGVYARIKYAYAPDFWKGDHFTGGQFELDTRGYYPLNTNLTIAAQGVIRSTIGSHTPFYVFRELGGDMTMRGYYLGRYRDKNYLTAQAELRYRFHPRFGITGFAGTGSTFSKDHKMRLVPSLGGGIRYFFSLEHLSTVRIDYAVGEKRAGEKRQSGFYLSISEAF